ncbi:hypothetical protein V500_02197 [Pseudogymnoascus sp. VKM F-4518 (FW-2643)]|nr:hypothetical protein V500_02197 [Pseudogymnoascus sp. VKM F-4518 (FW-2643)]
MSGLSAHDTCRYCIDDSALQAALLKIGVDIGNLQAVSGQPQNINIIENHATGDAVQVMVSANGKTLHGTNRAVGWRSRQIGGYLDNETVRQISRDMVTITIKTADEGEPRFGGETATVSDDRREMGEIRNLWNGTEKGLNCRPICLHQLKFNKS